MKLDDEFKRSIDKDFREGDYVAKKFFRRVIIGFLILVITVAATGLAYKMVYVNANREIFKHSIAYTETAAQFLAKEYREYNSADNDADRNAIMQYVIDRYPNLNPKDIENRELREFYNKCLKGGN